MTETRVRSSWRIGLVAFILALCAGPASAAATLRLTASPKVIRADGRSTTLITARLSGSRGGPVRNGTEVRFVTTAGSITPGVFTSSGVARATLTASDIPASAVVTAFSGTANAYIYVQMVSQEAEANVGGLVLRVKAKYVAFSEDKKFIQADDTVQIRFRGAVMEANTVQIDMNQNVMRLLGDVNITSAGTTKVGQRLFVNLDTFDAYIVAISEKQYFNVYGMTPLAEDPKTLNPDFELVDISDSKLLWVGKEAVYIIGDRVQVKGASAYLGGVKTLRLPFHETSLHGAPGEGTGNYIGIGTEGLVVDIPFYLAMSPQSSSSIHLRHGERTGTGFYNRNSGFHVDVVQRYGLVGRSEGQLTLTNLVSADWGLNVEHSQQFGKKTRAHMFLDFPAHRDLFARVNVNHLTRFGSFTGSFQGTKLQRIDTFTTGQDLTFETIPVKVLGGKGMVSLELRHQQRSGGTLAFRPSLGRGRGRRLRVGIASHQTDTIGVKFRQTPVRLAPGITLNNTVTVRDTFIGSRPGLGMGFESGINAQLSPGLRLITNYNYNRVPGLEELPNLGQHHLSGILIYSPKSRFSVSMIGSMELDAPGRSFINQFSYQLSDQWRFDMLQTFFQYSSFSEKDYQFGIARMLGNRELVVYWSAQRHRWVMEFGAGRF